MRRRARGIVGLVVLSLGLGVVTTYGVAWVVAGMFRPSFKGFSFPGSKAMPGWFVQSDARTGVVWLESGEGNEDLRGGLMMSGPFAQRDLAAWSLVDRMSPNEAQVRSGLGTGSGVYVRLQERAAGWPWLAVVSRACSGLPVAPKPVSGADWSIRLGNAFEEWSGKTIAFAPVWPGFGMDVVVYGGMWAMMVVSAIAIRRRLRVGVGRCATCRYDLSGLTGGVCPECGSAVKGM